MASSKKEVLKLEEQRLRDYELVFIVSPDVSDGSFETIIDSVSQFVTNKGGTIADVERWGKRRLAYPIKHLLEGQYVMARFNMNPMWSKELEASLQISEDILRHLLIRLDD